MDRKRIEVEDLGVSGAESPQFAFSTRETFSFAVVLLEWCVLLSTFGCGTSESESSPARSEVAEEILGERIVSRELSRREVVEPDALLFEDVPRSTTGVDFENRFVVDHPMSFLNLAGFVCGGICIGDLNGDGRPDLFLASGAGRNRLYIQTGDLRFEDVTDRAKVAGGDAWGAGAAMVDIDNDGDLDIYICNYDAPNQLFINEGSAERFTESARRYGLDVTDASLMSAFADYDNDGDLDAFVLTHRYYRPGGRPNRPPVGFRSGRPYILPEFEKYYFLRETGPNKYTADTSGRADYLFRNNGDGTFSNVSRNAGIREPGHGYSAIWWDYNSDGRVDLYVGNDFTDPDHLYRNNGNGTFTDVISETMPYTTWSSMGADCADLNNDGLLDFMSADMAPTTHYKTMISAGELGDRRWFLENAWPRQTMRNTVFLNTGTGRFMEVAYLAGLAATDWTWAVKMADFNNDGRVDVFVTNGASRMSTDADLPVVPGMLVGRTEWDIWKDTPPMKEMNLAFQNEGDLRFKEVGKAWGLDHAGMSFGAAYGDLDGDGDLDLVVANLGERVRIYRNRGTPGHRLVVALRGTVSNRFGIGAVVRIETASGGTQIRQLQPATGYLSYNEPSAYFGLGADDRIKRLIVEWPSGQTQLFEDLDVDRRYVITEAASESVSRTKRGGAVAPQFTESSSVIGLKFEHRERPFDDYQRQPLLPAKHSQLGGGMAWGDADGDGDDDLFVSGAAGQGGRLFLNQGNGSFSASTASLEAFDSDKEFEDMASVWLDADSDGDLDLLVTSGSVEFEGNDAMLHDRLYLNDGKGGLRRASESVLPPAAISSGVAVAGDFDGDNDLDLFIGGRVIPGRYPEIPESRLLRNDRGVFRDVTLSLAPELKRAGLVTGALWSDANADGKLDLLVTCEWGPVRYFANTGNGFAEHTEIAGLGDRIGWWNAITGADVDHDGDMDYIVMNAGLNTKYGKPTGENPAILFYGDFEGKNAKRIVEAAVRDGRLVPIRSLSRSAGGIPSVGTRFQNHRQFAGASLAAVYTRQRLDEAMRLEANHLESGVLVNNGEAKFSWQSMPALAQASPGFGVVATEIDGDDRIDIQIVQNLYSREPETGLWRGGIGVTIHSDETGRLQVARPDETGFIIDGDAKGLTVCDLNGDGRPDFVVTQNNGRLLAFENRGTERTKPLVVRLEGPRGNPTGASARVAVFHQDGRTQVAEVYAGSGYLSQSSPSLFFGAGNNPIERIETRWTDGRITASTPETSAEPVLIRYASESEPLVESH